MWQRRGQGWWFVKVLGRFRILTTATDFFRVGCVAFCLIRRSIVLNHEVIPGVGGIGRAI